jgi:hypothetical protein
MKNLTTKAFLFLGIVMASMTSCSTYNKSMREPNTRVELTKSDFTLSEQVSAEASSTKIFGIDWARLFKKDMGTVEGGAGVLSLASIPVIGNYLNDKTANYALHELMQKNTGYDVIFYPQYETKVNKPIGIGFIVKKTTVKVTARLATLKK